MKRESQAVHTGFRGFDRLTGGLHSSDLVCIASRPSMGKTALALNIATNVALAKKPRAVAVFSLEMSKSSVMQRLVAAQAQVGLVQVRKGTFPRKRWTSLTSAAAALAEAPLYLDDAPALTAKQIGERSQKLAAELRRKGDELGLIIIDYLQLMRGPKGKRNRRLEIKEIARSLKGLARKLKIPVLVLSQVRRRASRHGEADLRPKLTDLLESDSVAEVADLVAFVYRDVYYRPRDRQNENLAELILAKNARGTTGTVHLEFIRDFTQFRNLN